MAEGLSSPGQSKYNRVRQQRSLRTVGIHSSDRFLWQKPIHRTTGRTKEILRVYRIVVEVLFQHLFNNFVRHSPIDFRKNTVDKLVMSELLVSRIREPAKACRQQLLHI